MLSAPTDAGLARVCAALQSATHVSQCSEGTGLGRVGDPPRCGRGTCVRAWGSRIARGSEVYSTRSVVSAGVLSLGGLEVREAPAVVSSSRATAQCFPIADVAVDVLILFFTELVARASGETASGYISISIG
jgi:hypothetical protein